MQIEVSTYETYLLQGILDRQIKEYRSLRSRMSADDPFRKSMTTNIEYLEGFLAKISDEDAARAS